jgi:uncharacterized protein YjbJ (UPF0337 family)
VVGGRPAGYDEYHEQSGRLAAGPTGKRFSIMGILDDAKNKAEELAGKAKEAVGKATDNKDLEAEGHKDQAKGNIKQVGEKAKDVLDS